MTKTERNNIMFMSQRIIPRRPTFSYFIILFLLTSSALLNEVKVTALSQSSFPIRRAFYSKSTCTAASKSTPTPTHLQMSPKEESSLGATGVPATSQSTDTSNDANNCGAAAAEAAAVNALYWNRETSASRQYGTRQGPITRQAKIICISDPNDDANQIIINEETLTSALTSSDADADAESPSSSAKILAVGSQLEDFDIPKLKEDGANVIFCSHAKAREPLAQLLTEIDSIQWVHCRSAGIDYITSEALAESASRGVIVTNAKGSFSSTLAEYTMMAISYFAKDLPRLMRQKKDKNWGKYCVEEIRFKTLGIIGFGDIGRACAKLAKAYGMNVTALRRNPQKSAEAGDDELCDVVYPSDKASLHRLMSESDYILCALPLTAATKGMIDKEAFDHAKSNSVFINVGRGPIVDEDALIDALKSESGGSLKGAALDVFATEPLPVESELWSLDNVLMSPHNMDATETFQHEAANFFVEENLPRFLRGENLLNPVDQAAGY